MSRRRILGFAFSAVIFGLPYFFVMRNYVNAVFSGIFALVWGLLGAWVIHRVTKE
jgi:hypothetical protein